MATTSRRKTKLRIDQIRRSSHWELDDPKHPVTDWQAEVANDDTRLGYKEWLLNQYESGVNEEASGA